MSIANFVHLRIHTEFSLHDSVVRIKPLIKSVAGKKMPACAITDLTNFYGLIKFYKAAKDSGVQPIPAVDIRVKRETTEPSFRVLMLAQNREGYRQLCEMLTAAYKKNPDQQKTQRYFCSPI